MLVYIIIGRVSFVLFEFMTPRKWSMTLTIVSLSLMIGVIEIYTT
jgi:hypothetical protein